MCRVYTPALEAGAGEIAGGTLQDIVTPGSRGASPFGTDGARRPGPTGLLAAVGRGPLVARRFAR